MIYYVIAKVNSSTHCISPKQYGFVTKRCTVTNLVRTFTQFVSNVGQINTVYTNFFRAFNQTDHSILLQETLYNRMLFVIVTLL